MKIIFCGGGTAGHITPAIAIAEYLSSYDKNTDILFIGREDGEENRAVKRNGFSIKTLKIHGIERKINFENLKNVYIALKALRRAKGIIKDFSPDIVFGTGGYVTWPVIKSAQKLGIPTMIHESNACPGLVTRLLSTKCDKVLLGLNGSEKEFKRQDNIKVVGNPVREEFLTLDKKSARRRLGINPREFLISSYGGSGGSQKINESAIAIMKNHSSKHKNIRHIHSCGKKYYNELKIQYPEFTSGYCGCIIKPYIDDMPTVMAASDAIISRCGAMTLAEMSAAGSASILIPSPNVTNNHQYKNAKLICESGAAIMIEENELNERTLLDAIRKLESDMLLRKNMGEQMKSFHIPNTKEMIVKELFDLI